MNKDLPTADQEGDVTLLLQDWQMRGASALEDLLPLVTEDLRRIAGRAMSRERKDHTLQPTALINELFLKLAERRTVHWRNRAQFLGFAAQAMRRLLVDHARLRSAEKRGSGQRPVPFDEARDQPQWRDSELIALDDALVDLAKLDRRQAQVVELRFFAGLGYEEIGQSLKISPRTAKREWQSARFWLHQQLRADSSELGRQVQIKGS